MSWECSHIITRDGRKKTTKQMVRRKPCEKHIRELSFFSSRGGGGGVEMGWKTLLNFLTPLEAAEILLIPLSICENFMWPHPPSNHHHQKFVGLIMMSCRRARVIIALASWGSGGAVRSSGQSLRGGPGVGAHISSENPGVSNSKKWAILGIAHNNVGNCLKNLPRSEKRLDVLLQC